MLLWCSFPLLSGAVSAGREVSQLKAGKQLRELQCLVVEEWIVSPLTTAAFLTGQQALRVQEHRIYSPPSTQSGKAQVYIISFIIGGNTNCLKQVKGASKSWVVYCFKAESWLQDF